MGLLDSIVGRAFRDEKSGRVVVFSGDRRHRGYLVKSESEELKIRSFLKMFYFAQFAILGLGTMVANAWSMFFTNLQSLGRPVEHVLRNMCISLGAYCLVVGVPYFLLWRSYKRELLGLVSVQDEVVVSGKVAGRLPWMMVLAGLAVALLMVIVAVLFLVQAK
jgi:hypothetical protein